MLQLQIDNTSIGRRVVRAICDILHRPLADLRVLDLACAHGQYSIEMARHGATVVGIEGRESWLAQARQSQQAMGLSNVQFIQDDVRNLSADKYGEFDVVLCLGILYHLDAPSVFDFVDNVSQVCRDLAIFETHFAATPEVAHEWRGNRYWGSTSREHDPGTTAARKLEDMAASLDNEESFWFTQASLCNLLQHVGFTSVYDCRNPMAHLFIGPEREFKMWGNRVTFAAIKGRPLSLFGGAPLKNELELDWPEHLDDILFERYLVASPSPPTASQPAEHTSPPTGRGRDFRRLLSRLLRR